MADSKRARSWKRRTQPRIDLTNAEPVLYSTQQRSYLNGLAHCFVRLTRCRWSYNHRLKSGLIRCGCLGRKGTERSQPLDISVESTINQKGKRYE